MPTAVYDTQKNFRTMPAIENLKEIEETKKKGGKLKNFEPKFGAINIAYQKILSTILQFRGWSWNKGRGRNGRGKSDFKNNL